MKSKVFIFLAGFILWGATFLSDVYAEQLVLTWVDNSTNELGFTIERGDVQTGPFTEIATVNSNLQTYADATVIVATHYCYRVRAFNTRVTNDPSTRQYSQYSNVACGASGTHAPPGDPTNLQLSYAQEAIGKAVEQLGIAQTRLSQLQQR